jgi:hypothetical protein
MALIISPVSEQSPVEYTAVSASRFFSASASSFRGLSPADIITASAGKNSSTPFFSIHMPLESIFLAFAPVTTRAL